MVCYPDGKIKCWCMHVTNVELEKKQDKCLSPKELLDSGDNTTHVLSPCIGVCYINKKTQYCEGCFRTEEEIIDWGSCTNLERVNIIIECIKRKTKNG